MKKLFILLTSLTLTATSSLASELTLTIPGDLPVLQNVRLTRSFGDGLATVQPRGFIEFTYKSCGERIFGMNERTVNGVSYLSIIEHITAECFGPTVAREYSVQFTADATLNEKVVILNPQTLESPNLF